VARCAACGTRLWAQHLSGRDYYREEVRQRGLRCGTGRAVIRGRLLEEQVEDIVKSLRLPRSWRDLVLQYLSSAEEREHVAAERRRLQERKRRLYRTYLDGLSQDEYERELAGASTPA